jgi:hypothetical protein
MARPRRSFSALFAALVLVLPGCGREREPVLPVDDPPSAPRVGKLALLVGVTKYDHGYRRLHGPANDVRLFRKVLTDTFGFPAGNIVELTDEGKDKPTRENIRQTFRDLAGQAREGDQVAILLSGHGSEQPDQVPPDPDDPEPNGMDQVFLPADAGRPDLKRKVIPNGIIDDELRVWLKAITDKGARVFLVADCCHSGTLLRGESDEGVRGVPAGQLWPAEVIEEARRQGAGVRGAGASAAVLPSPFKLEKQSALVALYACQPEQKAYEFPLPDPDADKHGLLSWTVCQVLTRAGSPLTYRELARAAHESILRYAEDSALARERIPIPFAEGDDLDREVLGAKRWPGRSRLVLHRGKRSTVNGGKLHGLYPGAVLAVHPPAGEAGPDRLLGHVRVSRSDAFSSEVEPCPYEGRPAPGALPDKARVRVAYLVHDLKSLRVLVGPMPDADRLPVESALKGLSADKDALVGVVRGPGQATWAIRSSEGKLWLLPARANPTEPSSSRFELPREGLAALRSRLGQIARGQNLLAVASACAQETSRDAKIDVEVEIRRLRDKDDPDGVKVSGGARALRLRAGEWVRYRIHNRGKTPVDVTLLAVFADYTIASFFPEKPGERDNRVPPGRSAQTDPLKMDADTLGLEHLVAIAVDGTGRQQVDFACLAEDNQEAARGALVRGGGGQPVLQTPLGQLFAHALFRRGQVRGAGPDAGRYQMRLLSWQTLPGEAK